MSIKTISQRKLTWINIDRIDKEALDFLKNDYNFHHLDLEDLQSEQQTAKIDNYKNYLFIILQFPQWNSLTNTLSSQEIDMFVGENYLITIQHNKSKEMKNFFYRCMNNKKIKSDWMSGDSGYLAYQLIDSLFKNTRPILNRFGKKISNLEDNVFEDHQDSYLVKELAIQRRNILHFRRIIDPERYLIANLSHIRKPFIDEKTSLYFDDVGDYLNKIWVITDTYKDTIDGLHVTVESLINQKTNKVIGSLTIISVSLLPLTLLSGIYGMNIAGLPFAHNPGWVWGMFLSLMAIIIIAITVMRKKKLI